MATNPKIAELAAQYGEHVKQAGAFALAATAKLEKVAQAEEAWAAKSTELATKVANAGLIVKDDAVKFAELLREGDVTKVAQVIEHLVNQATKAASFQGNQPRSGGRATLPKQASASGMSESEAVWAKHFG